MKDFHLLGWLGSVVNPPVPTIAIPAAVAPTNRHFADTLKDLAHRAGVPMGAIEKLLAFKNTNFPNKRLRYYAVSDFTKHSSEKRLFVFDTVEGTVDRYFVAHGRGSDPEWTGFCKSYSNEPNSLCTSKGIYVCSETYVSLKFGYAMRLEGMESTNNNARKRAVVFHGAKYSEESYVKQLGKGGRSEGCQAVGFQYSKDLIDKLKDGSLLIVWSGENNE